MNFKQFLGLTVFLLLVAILGDPEPSDDDMYPTTRYERCMVLYGDTDKECLCDKERATEGRNQTHELSSHR
jgi:hypothetical protein